MPRLYFWTLAAALAVSSSGPIWAQANTPPDQSAPANVKQSQQYEQVLHSNPAFRAKRMQEECGPITDPQLHASCVASFGPDTAPTSGKRRQQ